MVLNQGQLSLLMTSGLRQEIYLVVTTGYGVVLLACSRWRPGRDAAAHPTCTGHLAKNDLAPNVNSAELENPALPYSKPTSLQSWARALSLQATKLQV